MADYLELKKYNSIMKYRVTCLIPFYNEDSRVLSTLDVISQSHLISQIICIDDGSTDNASNEIRQRFPNVKLIVLSENNGKANTFKEGLRYVDTKFVLLFDADLSNIIISEVEAALIKIDVDENIDMIILRRVVESKFLSAIRHDIVMSGQRVLKTEDFLKVFDSNPRGYAIETSINTYMMKNNKKVFWMPLSTKNPYKYKKMGIKKSIRFYWNTFIGYFSSGGVVGYVHQIFTFCKQQAV